MFLEPHFKGKRNGWIEVICGCMFSGKTEELIRRLKRATIAQLKVEVFKPQVDTRLTKQTSFHTIRLPLSQLQLTIPPNYWISVMRPPL